MITFLLSCLLASITAPAAVTSTATGEPSPSVAPPEEIERSRTRILQFAIDGEMAYYGTDRGIFKRALGGAASNQSILIAHLSEPPWAMGVFDGHLFWIDGAGVKTIPLGGRGRVRTVAATEGTWAVEVIADGLFVAAVERRARRGQQRMRVLRFNSWRKGARVVLSGADISPLALHVANGFVFVATDDGLIYKVPVNGGPRREVAADLATRPVSNPASASGAHPMQLTIDQPARITDIMVTPSHVVWRNELRQVKRKRLDGTGVVSEWPTTFEPRLVCGSEVIAVANDVAAVAISPDGGPDRTLVPAVTGLGLGVLAVKAGFLYWTSWNRTTNEVSILRRPLLCRG